MPYARLATFSVNGLTKYGFVADNGIVDLSARFAKQYPTLREVIAADALMKLINYISTFTTLMPGDVIVTGTPIGAGARFDPPRYLKPGDVIEVEADGVGALRNGAIDEA
jgi:hypothetical protein